MTGVQTCALPILLGENVEFPTAVVTILGFEVDGKACAPAATAANNNALADLKKIFVMTNSERLMI